MPVFTGHGQGRATSSEDMCVKSCGLCIPTTIEGSFFFKPTMLED